MYIPHNFINERVKSKGGKVGFSHLFDQLFLCESHISSPGDVHQLRDDKFTYILQERSLCPLCLPKSTSRLGR